MFIKDVLMLCAYEPLGPGKVNQVVGRLDRAMEDRHCKVGRTSIRVLFPNRFPVTAGLRFRFIGPV